MLIALFIIVLIALISVGVYTSYKEQQEENAIPKPVNGNIYRVVKSIIDNDKGFYVIEKYRFCYYSKKSFWNYVTRFDDYDKAIEVCEKWNNEVKAKAEEQRIVRELESTKNKQVMS